MVRKFAPLVKRQIEYWQNGIARYPADHPRYRPAKITVYQRLVDDFGDLLDYLNEQEGTDLRPAPPSPAMPARAAVPARPQYVTPAHVAPPPPAAEPPHELADLPPELLEQLSEGARAETDPLVKIIQDRGGTATLDEILIDLWRKYHEVGKRTVTANKLYRLSKRDLCWALPGKKGIYTTIKPSVSNADDKSSQKDEGPDAATSEPSSEMGAAGSPEGSPKASSVGSTPTASTPFRRKLMSETSVPSGISTAQDPLSLALRKSKP